MKTLSYPYLAALIDSEGHLGKPGNGLIINTTNRDLAIWLRVVVGGRLVRIQNRKVESQYKDVYKWNLKFNEVIEISGQLKKYLMIKKENLELWEKWSKSKKLTTNQYVKRFSQERHDIIKRLGELTRRGKSVVSQDTSNSVKLSDCGNNTELSSLKRRDEYLAGLIDGEGAIFIRTLTNTSRRGMQFLPDIVVVNTNRVMIEWIKNNYGGRINFRKSDDMKWKDRWCWNSNARNAKRISELISPYVIVKKDHVKLLKKFYSLPRTNTPSRWGKEDILPNAKFLTDYGWKKAHKIVATMSILNHKKSLLIKEKV